MMSASAMKGSTMNGNMNNSSPELEAFKRSPSLGLSQWENGNLTTNLAEKKDTNGAFLLVEAMLAPGTEPPPHVHTREDFRSWCFLSLLKHSSSKGVLASSD